MKNRLILQGNLDTRHIIIGMNVNICANVYDSNISLKYLMLFLGESCEFADLGGCLAIEMM